MWDDILLSTSLGKSQIKQTDESTHEKPLGDPEEASTEQVPPPEIDFSLEDLKNDIKVLKKMFH